MAHSRRIHAEDLLPAGIRVARNISLNYLYSGLMSVKLDWTVWMLFLSYRGIGFVEIGLIESASRLSSLAFGVPAGIVSDILGSKASAVLSVFACLLTPKKELTAGKNNGRWYNDFPFAISIIPYHEGIKSEFNYKRFLLATY